MIACLVALMIASKRCSGQCDSSSICTDKEVLIHLYKESVSAQYLRKDTAHLIEVISIQGMIIDAKDSINASCSKALIFTEKEAAEKIEGLNRKLRFKDVVIYILTGLLGLSLLV